MHVGKEEIMETYLETKHEMLQIKLAFRYVSSKELR